VGIGGDFMVTSPTRSLLTRDFNSASSASSAACLSGNANASTYADFTLQYLGSDVASGEFSAEDASLGLRFNPAGLMPTASEPVRLW
jgi:hypothetical protein